MPPAIRVENLSKAYRLGAGSRTADGYRTLREALVETAAGAIRPLGRALRPGGNGAAAGTAVLNEPPPRPETFWALRDVSFEVQPGEVVGIIGRNGAGKSTLLKVLTRITEPSSGRAELRGRVGSLLEVGTGFHPELTGRENIYLNGSIIGMSRREITARFDEIVAFSEIEKFLDTPVKRYSSGMYVRLAFAVAAHLEPEILIVDEVLAVGDAAFQKKCIRKIGEVSQSGRTVLIVSHNLASITTLCTRALMLEQGRMTYHGGAAEIVSRYLTRMREDPGQDLEHRLDREGTGRARVVSLRFTDRGGDTIRHILCGDSVEIVIGYQAQPGLKDPHVALSLWSTDGHKIFHVDNLNRGQDLCPFEATGEYRCGLSGLDIAPGLYYLNVLLRCGEELLDHVYSATELEVLPSDFYGIGKVSGASGGLILVDHKWN